MTPDRELLQHYAATNSEDAFAELVRRHVNLVYSAALRQVNGDAHLAHDVAQTVFTDLAGKAGSLVRRGSLTGWLYTSAHFAAAKIVRGETRRRDREEKFMREPTNETAPNISHTGVLANVEADWQQIRPALDEAMHELKAVDREAVLLRYFENRQFAEVGAKLGLNENAARMRVERAVEKLRLILTKRGIATTAALAAAISANAIQIAPAGLAVKLTATSLAATAAGTLTLAKIMTTMKLKLIFGTLVVAGAATALIVQHQGQTKLAEENESLSQQISRLQTDNTSLSNRMATAGNSASTSLSQDQYTELLKLRGEVGVLRRQVGELGKLRDENAKVRRELTAATQTVQSLSSPEQMLFNKKHVQIVNDAKQIGLAMRIWAGDNEDQYPTNFEVMTNELGGITNAMQYKETYELVNIGVANEKYPQMIMLLEIAPRQTPDGKWERIYGLADGSVQTATSPDGNFDAWEKANTSSPPSQ